MATKDFQELIKAQQETTKALMSAEEAARYDALLAERQLEFDKKSQAIKAGLKPGRRCWRRGFEWGLKRRG